MNYWTLLNRMFNTTYGADSAGLSYIRVPIGASDFSAHCQSLSLRQNVWSSSESVYSLDDISGDTSFSRFNIDNAPSYLFSVLSDILFVNSHVKVHIVPWSPVRRLCLTDCLFLMMLPKPGWMKDSGTMNGGSLLSQYDTICKLCYACS